MIKNICDIIIVGGGPAGKVSLITHYLSVDNSESGESFKKKEDQIKKYEIETINEEIITFDLKEKVVTTKSGDIYKSLGIILANGMTLRKLGIPGEKELTDKGISSNPSKDGKNYIGKDIFVVGGADGAIKEAIYLSKYAKKMSIIHFEEALGTIVGINVSNYVKIK
ncbi:MAG: NAD(P)/FAD-dependent oxidoreductase [Cetobacterium sp.]